VLKILPPPGFDPRTVQPIAGRYTDYNIPAFSDVRIAHKIVVEIPEGNRPLQRSGFQLEDAVRSYVWEVEYDIAACFGILLLNSFALNHNRSHPERLIQVSDTFLATVFLG